MPVSQSWLGMYQNPDLWSHKSNRSLHHFSLRTIMNYYRPFWSREVSYTNYVKITNEWHSPFFHLVYYTANWICRKVTNISWSNYFYLYLAWNNRKSKLKRIKVVWTNFINKYLTKELFFVTFKGKVKPFYTNFRIFSKISMLLKKQI